MDQMWYLIVLIPDICLLSYFVTSSCEFINRAILFRTVILYRFIHPVFQMERFNKQYITCIMLILNAKIEDEKLDLQDDEQSKLTYQSFHAEKS